LPYPFKTTFQTTPNYLSILHCNIRSLPKNLNILEDILYSLEYTPNILGITETKLNEESCSNVDIKNYNFFHTNSKTNAGGATLYIANDIKSIPRPDIQFQIDGPRLMLVKIKKK
jgi:exonuclease III